MAVHAAVYGRQSAGRANKSEVSTATQRTAGVAEATRRGADSITTYEDLGISAFTGDARPDFDRMIKDCLAGRINLIVVYYVSRLTRRDPLESIPLVTELLNLGVTIVSLTEGEFRRGNLMDLIHLIMRLDAAHNESKNKRDAVQGAKRTALELGGYLGGKPPYGFRMVPVTRMNSEGKPVGIQLLEHEPDEVRVVQDVWRTIKKHKGEPYKPGGGRRHPGSLTGICSQMTTDGIPTRGQTIGKETKDSVWDPKTLMRILRDPRVAGYAATPLYKRRDDGKLTSAIEGYRIERDPETMKPIVTYPPIIPPDEWHELQEWLDGRGQGKGLSRGHALLSAMEALFCECDAFMTSHRATTPNKGSYRCRRRRALPGQHEGDCTISQKTLDQYVARRIFALIQSAEEDPETADILAEATRRYAAQTEDPELTGERRSLLAERADARQALEELYDREEAGDYDDPVGRRRFRERKARLLGVMERTEARLSELESAATPALPIHLWLAPGAPAVDPIGPGSWWDTAPIEDKRAFVKLFIERITISKSAGPGKSSPVETRTRIQFVRPSKAEEDEPAELAT
ncbi:recombinase family protein [Streptomyces benahoarensis]|uniref:Recombinase family protein n=1 Tax=Streptomyces benahoarensis TaxID=2595054 RepID=A0A553Z5T8_9ACTN|nr:recombinase family protein [Streptomyces benahoarensis]TSB19185.1 recombinase family protein [Streptomyces benahoarensis]TSB36779.1 recombinase family protein [Streptomyces benahoarensis]